STCASSTIGQLIAPLDVAPAPRYRPAPGSGVHEPLPDVGRQAGQRNTPAAGVTQLFAGKGCSMGRKPVWTLAGLLWVGLTLSGCETCNSCWGQKGPEGASSPTA